MQLTQIVNGQITELVLCESCARNKGLFDPQSLSFAEQFFPEEFKKKVEDIVKELAGGKLLADMIDAPETELTYPLVIKPIDGRSSQGLHIVKNETEMRSVAELCREDADHYLVQPKISGPVITVDVVRNPETEECVCIPRRELLRTLNGAGTSVYVFKNEYLEKQCKAIAKALNICGCVNFEFVEEIEPAEKHGSGKWRFLECNPRFSGGLAFSAVAGYDMVRNHINCFKGIGLEPEGEIRDQYVARRYTEVVTG